MKRGYYVLIGGAALFVIGVVVGMVWAIPIAEEIQRDTVTIPRLELEVGQSVERVLEVTDTSRPLSVIMSSTDADVPLALTLFSPDGETLLDSNFTENTVMSAEPAAAGDYTLRVMNLGQSSTSVDVIFGHLPGVGQNNQVDFETFGGMLVGIGIIIAGIIVMVAGVAIIIVDRRRRA